MPTWLTDRRTTIATIALLAIAALLGSAIWIWQMRYAVSDDQSVVMEVRTAHARSAAGDVILVDVRRPSEWRASGVPATAHAITMHQDEAAFIRKLVAAAGGRRDRALALICATGGRTSWLEPRLRAAGFSALYNVAEGMMGSSHGPGWLKMGLPVRRWSGDTAAAGRLD